MDRFKKFEPLNNARMALNYITSMVDEKYDNLPYWLILPNKKPAEAAHCRVDDAELVGSWYEGLDALQNVLNTKEGSDVLESFRRHLMKSWGEHGLRFHEDYPWSHTNHSSFHEMGYILPALNRIIAKDNDDGEAKMRARNLIAGMRSLVIERKVKTFWSGDSEVEYPIYQFPNDVYLEDGGFDLSRFTGRGEQAIRNSIILHSLVINYELTGDDTALDLAIGTVNYLLNSSRYFNYKMEYFGHVHSAMWVASGMIRLGRVIKEPLYIRKGKEIYDYTRSISSSFGWVPEYAQWHPMDEEHCETCCIKDMIQCADELIQCGYEQYYNDMNLFARNQLLENQVTYTDYVEVDNSLEDTQTTTYRDIDKRIIGGFTGGSEPNSMSLTKFRSIAGCCVGMAPVAFEIFWNRSIEFKKNTVIVNIPLDKKTKEASITMGYPNKGYIKVNAFVDCNVAIRKYDWMGNNINVWVDDKKTDCIIEDNLLIVKGVKSGSIVEFRHKIDDVEIIEVVAGNEYNVYWRGCDVIGLLPEGKHLRLYQRDNSIPKYYPTKDDVTYTGAANYGPTQQKQ